MIGLEALSPAKVLERALAAAPAAGKLSDIRHVVIFINENRSFDHYFGSVIGSTLPNRLYTVSASIDPEGRHGGPVIETESPRARAKKAGTYTWPTYPEQLEAKGISWKFYGTPETLVGDNVLPYFRPYLRLPKLRARAFRASFPGPFKADCKAGRLPQVSWVLAPFLDTEHPPGPVSYGEIAAAGILASLASNPSLWA